MKSMKTKKICTVGILAAFVAAATMLVSIPVPATNGYIHLGDSVIFLCAVLFGAKYGMLAGGIGSFLADILMGYPHWAVPSLIIKCIMGYICGFFATQNTLAVYTVKNCIGIICSALWMVFGYFIFGALLKGSFAVAATSILENAAQATGGAIIFFVAAPGVKKALMKTSVLSYL